MSARPDEGTPDRRTTLKLAGATLLALPASVACARLARTEAGAPVAEPPAPDPVPSAPRGSSPLSRAIAEAERAGKPVLVLVELEPVFGGLDAGYALASAFERGDTALLADLALCEVARARRDEVEAIVGEIGGASIGLIERRGSGRAWIALSRGPQSDPSAWRAAIAGDAATLARRVRDAELALGPSAVEEIRARIAAPWKLDVATADRGAALVRAEAGPTGLRRLAEAAEARLWRGAPHGARWARHGMCGAIEVEAQPGDPQGAFEQRLAALCGMGHFGASAERFLVYYAGA